MLSHFFTTRNCQSVRKFQKKHSNDDDGFCDENGYCEKLVMMTLMVVLLSVVAGVLTSPKVLFSSWQEIIIMFLKEIPLSFQSFMPNSTVTFLLPISPNQRKLSFSYLAQFAAWSVDSSSCSR